MWNLKKASYNKKLENCNFNVKKFLKKKCILSLELKKLLESGISKMVAIKWIRVANEVSQDISDTNIYTWC